MIDEQKTFDSYGYVSSELKPKSHKPIVAVCVDCGRYRVLGKADYRLLCKACACREVLSRPEVRQTISKKRIGKKHLEKTILKMKKTANLPKNIKIRSEANKGRAKTETHKRKISEAQRGRTFTEETKNKMVSAHKNRSIQEKLKIRCKTSATKRGISIDEWNGFVGRHANRPHALSSDLCILLNKPFVGCEGHHLSRSLLIYIPKELHNHIRHNLKTGRGMASINALALQYSFVYV